MNLGDASTVGWDSRYSSLSKEVLAALLCFLCDDGLESVICDDDGGGG